MTEQQKKIVEYPGESETGEVVNQKFKEFGITAMDLRRSIQTMTCFYEISKELTGRNLNTGGTAFSSNYMRGKLMAIYSRLPEDEKNNI